MPTPHLGATTPPCDCDIVIFGGTGDLALRKLLPALSEAHANGTLCAGSRLFMVSRSTMTTREFIHSVEAFFLANGLNHHTDDPTHWAEFCQRIEYLHVDAHDSATFNPLKEALDQEPERVRVVYLSIHSNLYQAVIDHLAEHQLITDYTRVVVEKPIGHDIESARAINNALLARLREDQIFRIDHYLGKETVQNLMVLRFGNPLFESQWNHQFIDNIQITIAESIGVEGRADFYESTGALRDMVQNHLLQLLCMVAMEPPHTLDANAVRDEKLKVIQALRPWSESSLQKYLVRGQYQEGNYDTEAVPAYAQEPGVNPNSQTETFVAMRVKIDNMRWAGVPFYLRTGKRLPTRTCQIVVDFKPVAHSIFGKNSKHRLANRLTLELQPDEGMTLRICSKSIGAGMKLIEQDLNLNQEARSDERRPDAYERLLLDAIQGQATLFMRADELEAAWEWVDPIIQYWAQDPNGPARYKAGTWGPDEATVLLAKDNRLWTNAK